MFLDIYLISDTFEWSYIRKWILLFICSFHLYWWKFTGFSTMILKKSMTDEWKTNIENQIRKHRKIKKRR